MEQINQTVNIEDIKNGIKRIKDRLLKYQKVIDEKYDKYTSYINSCNYISNKIKQKSKPTPIEKPNLAEEFFIEDITKLFQDCFFDNVEPKDFLLKLPKVEDELMYEVFNLYHTYWHVRTCGPNRYKNCEMPLINVNAKMMHRGNYKEINKMIFYTINNPTVVKK